MASLLDFNYVNYSLFPADCKTRDTKFHRESPTYCRQTSAETPLSVYADHLRSFYCSRELPQYSKWPTILSPGHQYINLAVTQKNDLSKQEAGEFAMAQLQGDVCQILRARVPIKMKDIVSHETGKPLKCVLVEGAPGIGKSTFA